MFAFNNTTSQNTVANAAAPAQQSVNTIDAESNILDVSNLFAFSQKTDARALRPSDKSKQESEVESVLKAGELLSNKHKQYHNDFVVRGNQALYELLSEIYALALRINMSASSENILAAMRDALKERNIKTQVKCTLFK